MTRLGLVLPPLPLPSFESQGRSRRRHLVAVLLELLLGLVVDVGVLLRIRQLLAGRPLALVVRLALDLSPLLEPANAPSVCPFLLAKFRGVCASYLATTSLYFQPNSCPSLPTVQYFLPGFSLNTRSAWGTTMRFL